MKRKIFVLILTLSLLFSGMLTAVGGEATAKESEENLLQASQEINDWNDLDAVRDDLGSDYVLMDDLDENTEGYNELVDTDDGWDPIGEMNFRDNLTFTGTFDGNGHEISDLYVDRPETDNVGLFGCVNDGEITDIGIVDADVNGGSDVGALVGVSWAGTSVSNSYVTGEVSGRNNVGGLVGNNVGPVKNSYAASGVSGEMYVGGLVGENQFPVSNSYATGDVSGSSQVGGLVGSNSGDMISTSYATGDVSGSSEVGGLVGRNWMGTVETSYAAGQVNGDELVGGLVGENDNGTVSDSFWDEESTGQTEGFGENNDDFHAEGLTTSEMQGDSAEDNMDALDFENTWKTVDNDYPSLALEEQDEEAGDEEADDGIPGFTLALLVLSMVIVVTIYEKKR